MANTVEIGKEDVDPEIGVIKGLLRIQLPIQAVEGDS